MKAKKKFKMTFEVILDLDFLIDEKTLKEEYGGDIHKVTKWMYKNEGIWWDEPIKLIKTEILK